MFCPNCGNNNEDGVAFCASCGAPMNQDNAQPAEAQAPQQPVQDFQPEVAAPAAKPAGKGLAIASLVLGIVAFILFPYICGGLAIAFGAISKGKGYTGKAGIAGLILGIIAIALQIIVTIACESLGLILLG